MIRNPNDIQEGAKKIRMLIAGYPGIGKSTLALSAPNPLHIDVDFGIDRIEPRYQDVEIGGGRITGREFTPEHPGGIDFCMYHADQYAQPKGDYSKVYSADDAAWYKQYAADTVERKPYQTEDGKIAYHEKIVQKLPNPPQRKDRM